MKTIIIIGLIGLLIILCIIYILYLYNPTIRKSSHYNLKVDGLTICKNIFSISEINYMKQLCKEDNYNLLKHYLLNHFKLKREVNQILIPYNEYQLHDYIFIIKKSNIHTCHRDNNGSFYNKLQKYPSYTMIIYLENMKSCLSIIPTSHNPPQNKWWWNITNPLEHVLCNEGDIILFDANTIHAGSLPDLHLFDNIKHNNKNNMRIQLKISHREDLNTLSFYQKYNKMLNQENHMSLQINKIQQNLSCMFPMVSDLTQSEHKKKAVGTDNTILSFILSGNNDFYNFTDI
jgi:hypothetical protein